MNLLYCGDRNTEKGIMLSVLTLLENSMEPLHIYLLTMSYRAFRPISYAFADHLEQVVRGNGGEGSVHLVDCTDMFNEELPLANISTRFTPYCMLRLWADLVPGLPDRLLYLDYDVVCKADFGEFYHQDMRGVEYVAVPDHYGQLVYSYLSFWRRRYINSGVMLLNMNMIRRSGLLGACRRLCRSKAMFLPDQRALNESASSVRIAHRKYNDQRRSHPDTVFRHYSTTFRALPLIHTVSVKPWETEKMHTLLKDYSLDKQLIIMEKEMKSVRALENACDVRKETIPVFFAIDDNYAPWLAVAVSSIVRNSSSRYDYHLIILNQGLSEDHARRISSLSNDGFRVDFVPMKEKFEGIKSDFIGNCLRADYFTMTIYFRLFIPDMFPQYRKGIYLDSDIVVPGDLSKLYEMPLDDNLIGACPDFSIQEVKPLTDYVVNAVGVDSPLEYVNSGVLLMDLEKLRQVRLGERFLELLNRYHFDCVAPDQDYINAMCKGRILFLGEEWDAMPNDSKPVLENPQVIHYNLFAKPWCYDGIQYSDFFWHYAEVSGYYDQIRDFKDGYPEERRRADSESLERLVGRARMLSELSKDTFRAVFDSGIEARL